MRLGFMNLGFLSQTGKLLLGLLLAGFFKFGNDHASMGSGSSGVIVGLSCTDVM